MYLVSQQRRLVYLVYVRIPHACDDMYKVQAREPTRYVPVGSQVCRYSSLRHMYAMVCHQLMDADADVEECSQPEGYEDRGLGHV